MATTAGGRRKKMRDRAELGPIQSLSGAGTIDPKAIVCFYTSTGAGQALALADGTVLGQEVKIVHVVDGGSGVLTAGAALHLHFSLASITLTNRGDWVRLKWIDIGGTKAWAWVEQAGCTFA